MFRFSAPEAHPQTCRVPHLRLSKGGIGPEKTQTPVSARGTYLRTAGLAAESFPGSAVSTAAPTSTTTPRPPRPATAGRAPQPTAPRYAAPSASPRASSATNHVLRQVLYNALAHVTLLIDGCEQFVGGLDRGQARLPNGRARACVLGLLGDVRSLHRAATTELQQGIVSVLRDVNPNAGPAAYGDGALLGVSLLEVLLECAVCMVDGVDAVQRDLRGEESMTADHVIVHALHTKFLAAAAEVQRVLRQHVQRALGSDVERAVEQRAQRILAQWQRAQESDTATPALTSSAHKVAEKVMEIRSDHFRQAGQLLEASRDFGARSGRLDSCASAAPPTPAPPSRPQTPRFAPEKVFAAFSRPQSAAPSRPQSGGSARPSGDASSATSTAAGSGYRAFRPLSASRPPSAAPPPPTLSVEATLRKDEVAWAAFERRGGSFSDPDVPWPHAPIARIAALIGMSYCPNTLKLSGTTKALTVPAAELEAALAGVRRLQRRWHPDRCQQQLEGEGGRGGECEGVDADNNYNDRRGQLLVFATRVAQSINTLKDALHAALP